MDCYFRLAVGDLLYEPIHGHNAIYHGQSRSSGPKRGRSDNSSHHRQTLYHGAMFRYLKGVGVTTLNTCAVILPEGDGVGEPVTGRYKQTNMKQHKWRVLSKTCYIDGRVL